MTKNTEKAMKMNLCARRSVMQFLCDEFKLPENDENEFSPSQLCHKNTRRETNFFRTFDVRNEYFQWKQSDAFPSEDRIDAD